MRKNILAVLFCLSAMFTINVKSNAQTLIHYWHFNNYSQGAMYVPTISAIVADYTDLAGSNANILYKPNTGTSPDRAFVDSLQPVASDMDVLNAQMGEPSGAALRVRNPSDSMKLYFYIPTTNFENIVLKYATELSSTSHGMLQQLFDYSTDGGTTWKTSGLSETMDAAAVTFKLVTVSFSDTAANNNPNLVFRITFSGNDTGTSGNNRFDNVTVEGDTITATSGVAALSLNDAVYSMYPNPVNNSLEISAVSTGDKSVTITNEIGQTVFTGIESGKHFSVNTAVFTSGIYYISIRENNAGKVSTMKFIKQ